MSDSCRSTSWGLFQCCVGCSISPLSSYTPVFSSCLFLCRCTNSATNVRKTGDRTGRTNDALFCPFRVMYLTTAVACCSGLKSFLGGPLLTLRLLFLSLVCSRCVLCLIHSFDRLLCFASYLSLIDGFPRHRSLVLSQLYPPSSSTSCPITTLTRCLYLCVGYHLISRFTSTSPPCPIPHHSSPIAASATVAAVRHSAACSVVRAPFAYPPPGPVSAVYLLVCSFYSILAALW